MFNAGMVIRVSNIIPDLDQGFFRCFVCGTSPPLPYSSVRSLASHPSSIGPTSCGHNRLLYQRVFSLFCVPLLLYRRRDGSGPEPRAHRRARQLRRVPQQGIHGAHPQPLRVPQQAGHPHAGAQSTRWHGLPAIRPVSHVSPSYRSRALKIRADPPSPCACEYECRRRLMRSLRVRRPTASPSTPSRGSLTSSGPEIGSRCDSHFNSMKSTYIAHPSPDPRSHR